MPYLNLDLGYFDHPKTVHLVALLGRNAELLPIKLWSLCGRFFAENGVLIGYSADAIEKAIGWRGKKGEAIKALTDPRVAYLGGGVSPENEKDANWYRALGWSEHNGHIHALKVRGRINAKKRWGTYATSNAISNAVSNAISNAPSSLLVKQPLTVSALTTKCQQRGCNQKVKVPGLCVTCKDMDPQDRDVFYGIAPPKPRPAKEPIETKTEETTFD